MTKRKTNTVLAHALADIDRTDVEIVLQRISAPEPTGPHDAHQRALVALTKLCATLELDPATVLAKVGERALWQTDSLLRSLNIDADDVPQDTLTIIRQAAIEAMLTGFRWGLLLAEDQKGPPR